MAYLKSFIKRAPLVVREYIPSFGNNITLFAVFSFAQKFYEFLHTQNAAFEVFSRIKSTSSEYFIIVTMSDT